MTMLFMALLHECGPWEYNHRMLGALSKFESPDVRYVHPMVIFSGAWYELTLLTNVMLGIL